MVTFISSLWEGVLGVKKTYRWSRIESKADKSALLYFERIHSFWKTCEFKAGSGAL